jgi:thiol-disulfide isomerase/thioredoxin
MLKNKDIAMHRLSNLLLKLCLSSLVFSISLVAIASVKTSATASASSKIEVAQANPCASANPCAAKLGSVGGALASELQGKPVVVDIYASWCAACKNIAPTLSQLKQLSS